MRLISFIFMLILCSGCISITKAITRPLVESELEHRKNIAFVEALQNGWTIGVIDNKAVLVKVLNENTTLIRELDE